MKRPSAVDVRELNSYVMKKLLASSAKDAYAVLDEFNVVNES